MSAKKPNISQIRKYLNGELDARAMHQLERQAQDDPFLMDALEGYQQKGKEQQPNLDELQKRLHHRVAPARKRLVLWPSMAIAASVLLFLSVGGWWLVNYRSPSNTPNLPAVNNTAASKGQRAKAQQQSFKSDITVVKPAAPTVLEKALAAETKNKNRTTLIDSLALVANNSHLQAQTNEAKLNEGLKKAPAARVDSTNRAIILKGDALTKVPVTIKDNSSGELKKDLESGLQGAPGSDQTIRIRGASSLVGKEPLYVIDGVPYNGKLPDIPAKDIKNISILKDASTTAIYGSRGANGVILITTKNGKNVKSSIDSNLLAQNRLNEVVVVGYETQQRKAITGSVSTVTPAQIEQALQGRAAGVQVVAGSKKSKNKLADTLQTFTGKVIAGDDQLPLPGVNIAVSGKSGGTVTDATGKFRIKALPGDELSIKYIGYLSKNIKVKDKDSINVTLEESHQSLSDVVVVGYGTTAVKEPQNAQPQEGWSKFNSYIKENAKSINGKTGVVRVSFIVNANRSLSDFKILKSLSPEADKTAIKLIQDGPGWTPNSNGQPETVKLRISFKL